MNPPVEEWIEYNQNKFEKCMREADGDMWIEFEGKKVMIVKSIYLELACVSEATRYLSQELYWRQVQIIEKHC
jgi:hypothetical protein